MDRALWSILSLFAAGTPGTPLLEVSKLEVEAQPPPRVRTVAILILSGEESGIPLSEVYGNARKAIEENSALVVAPLDVLALEEREAAIRECAGKAACFASKVRANATTQVDLLLTVSLDRIDEGTLLGFRLVDVGSEEEIGTAGNEVPAGMSLLGAMERQLPEVFPRSVWGQISNLTVNTQPEGAEVTVAGRSCVSPCELTRIVPGTYDIAIKKSGYEPWSGQVTLNPKETAKIDQILLEPPAGITSSPFFWGGIAAVVVAAGVGAFFLFKPDSRIVRICVAEDRGLCE